MILAEHLSYFQEICSLPGFLAEPILCFGVQDIDRRVTLGGRHHAHLEQFFEAQGFEAHSLDYYDPRAALRLDMNEPVPESEWGRYRTLIDIGSMEHLFDTRQCMENCVRMLAVGGHYLLHTPVNGYYEHGYHVFNPAALVGFLELNGLRIVYRKYSTGDGKPVEWPGEGGDVLLWLVAAKEREEIRFKLPQQEMWKATYKPLTQARRSRPEALTLPRAPVEITFALTSRDSTGRYEWRLLTPNRQALMEGFSDAEVREGLQCVVVRADLSGQPPGDYLLAFRPANAPWVYSLVSLPAEYAVKLWKRS